MANSNSRTKPKGFLRRFAKAFLAFVLVCAVFGGLAWLEMEGIFMTELANTKERIKNSPNFKNGVARNKEFTALMTDKPNLKTLNLGAQNELNSGVSNLNTPNLSVPNASKSDEFSSDDMSRYKAILDLLKVPNARIPSVKSDLKAPQKDSFVWFGHSSYMLFLDGKSVLIDPILQDNAAPVPLIVKAFEGADIYSPDDLPKVDFLIITHNHYDHLSKKTLKKLAHKVERAIVPLGVGKYLKAWGIDEGRINELDWDEVAEFNGFAFHCLTARHFSGRGVFDQNKSLWASFLLEFKGKRLFFGGDSGYGAHFAEFGERFGGVDLAFLENGQFNKGWAQIHAFPHQSLQIAKDLRAKAVMSVHNSKFKLAPHAWNEPLEQLYTLYIQGKSQGNFDFALFTPQIGQIVPLWDDEFKSEIWWKE